MDQLVKMMQEMIRALDAHEWLDINTAIYRLDGDDYCVYYAPNGFDILKIVKAQG